MNLHATASIRLTKYPNINGRVLKLKNYPFINIGSNKDFVVKL
jgi:hypothetical protein